MDIIHPHVWQRIAMLTAQGHECCGQVVSVIRLAYEAGNNVVPGVLRCQVWYEEQCLNHPG